MTRDEIWKECFVNDFEEPNLKLEFKSLCEDDVHPFSWQSLWPDFYAVFQQFVFWGVHHVSSSFQNTLRMEWFHGMLPSEEVLHCWWFQRVHHWLLRRQVNDLSIQVVWRRIVSKEGGLRGNAMHMNCLSTRRWKEIENHLFLSSAKFSKAASNGLMHAFTVYYFDQVRKSLFEHLVPSRQVRGLTSRFSRCWKENVKECKDPVQDGPSPIPSRNPCHQHRGTVGKTVSRCFKYFATSPLRLSLHFQSWFEAIDIECKTCTAWHHLRRTLLQNVFQQALSDWSTFWRIQLETSKSSTTEAPT